MHSTILSKLQERGRQVAIASALGVSESTISRSKDDFEQLCSILAHLGLKVVESDAVCVDPTMYRAVMHIMHRALSDEELAERVVLSEG